MKVKVCGLSNASEVRACIEYGADFCGFILNYPKSHRFVSYEKSLQLTNLNKKKN